MTTATGSISRPGPGTHAIGCLQHQLGQHHEAEVDEAGEGDCGREVDAGKVDPLDERAIGADARSALA